MPLALAQLQDIGDRITDRLRPWSRSAEFWVRAADIYTSYKVAPPDPVPLLHWLVCQLRAGFVKDEEEREAMWEQQHELGAQKMYSLCSELGGLFLKAAQILGKPDLAPMAWVKRLVTLCDNAPATPIDVVRDVVEKQFGKSFDDIFECFDVEPVGSASIAQVHRARLKLSKTDVAVKVQHPGAEKLMMVDIRNMQAFALFLQKYDINFDLYSATKEMEKQICYEFDFVREAKAMERIREFLRVTNKKKPPVIVPRVIPEMVSREVLVMEFIEGTPIMNLGNEMAKRGIDPGGKIATMAKQKILTDLTLAYGQMILKDGFFHADPHPGNILICKNTEARLLFLFLFLAMVALLDYGQVKAMPEDLRLAYANLVIAMADDDFLRTKESFREIGIETWSIADNELEELFQLSLRMFDTRLPPGVTAMSPFAEDSSLNKVGVQQWKPIAEEALLKSGRLKAARSRRPRRSFVRRLFSSDNENQGT
ncbi:ABC transporter-like protein [Oryza sativa Japonica Group]|uniref:ABC transporter-like protein n=1 Tax=Oryza sativa subsp. japonica TaxID=39947 RepID=Q8RZ63_ORYSJ|nr:ABC transporter-like protein [Oryza sativa Japonica Group]